jgi:ABC-type dipeptide/oligopeptide/nickel transport system ATPase component
MYIHLKEHKSIKKLIEDLEPNYQCYRTAEKYIQCCEEKRTEPSEVIWIYGESGSGKTKMAHELTDDTRYVKRFTNKNKWFDGYEVNKHLIIDDFRGSQLDFTEFISILDGCEHRIEYKGGSRQLLAQTIVLTSINPTDFLT